MKNSRICFTKIWSKIFEITWGQLLDYSVIWLCIWKMKFHKIKVGMIQFHFIIVIFRHLIWSGYIVRHTWQIKCCNTLMLKKFISAFYGRHRWKIKCNSIMMLKRNLNLNHKNFLCSVIIFCHLICHQYVLHGKIKMITENLNLSN